GRSWASPSMTGPIYFRPLLLPTPAARRPVFRIADDRHAQGRQTREYPIHLLIRDGVEREKSPLSMRLDLVQRPMDPRPTPRLYPGRERRQDYPSKCRVLLSLTPAILILARRGHNSMYYIYINLKIL